MVHNLMYIELKSGYRDNGPTWIGYVKASQSGRTIYFNDHGFQRYNGCSGNYIDVETGEEYWISGVKKSDTNRHWAGSGKISIDRRAVAEYLRLTGLSELPGKDFTLVDMVDYYPVERIQKLLNGKK